MLGYKVFAYKKGVTAFDSRWQAVLWQFDICRSGGVRVSQIAPTL
jgi:hypothetical protein